MTGRLRVDVGVSAVVALLVATALSSSCGSSGSPVASPSGTAFPTPTAVSPSPTTFRYPAAYDRPITKDVGTRRFAYRDVRIAGRGLILEAAGDGLAVVVRPAAGPPAIVTPISSLEIVDLGRGTVRRVLGGQWSQRHTPPSWPAFERSAAVHAYYHSILRGLYGVVVSRRWLVWQEALLGIGNGGSTIACALYAAPLRGDHTIGHPALLEEDTAINCRMMAFALSGDRLAWFSGGGTTVARLVLRNLRTTKTTTLGETSALAPTVAFSGRHMLVALESGTNPVTDRFVEYDLSRDLMPILVTTLDPTTAGGDTIELAPFAVLSVGHLIAWSATPPQAGATDLYGLVPGRGSVV